MANKPCATRKREGNRQTGWITQPERRTVSQRDRRTNSPNGHIKGRQQQISIADSVRLKKEPDELTLRLDMVRV